MFVHGTTHSFLLEAEGLPSALDELRQALVEQPLGQVRILKEEPGSLSALLTPVEGTPLPDMDSLDPLESPGLVLAVTRLVPQTAPLPALRATRIWREGRWQRKAAALPR